MLAVRGFSGYDSFEACPFPPAIKQLGAGGGGFFGSGNGGEGNLQENIFGEEFFDVLGAWGDDSPICWSFWHLSRSLCPVASPSLQVGFWRLNKNDHDRFVRAFFSRIVHGFLEVSRDI